MDNCNEIKNLFDRWAKEWNNHPEEYGTREKIIALAGFPQGICLADIGCGCGVMFEHLLKTNPCELIAVDLSENMIRRAKRDFSDKRITFMCADFITSELPPVDAAILYNAYPHFLDKQGLVERFARFIKKDGLLVIAHGCGKAVINEGHQGETVSKISIPLEPAEQEAEKFKPFFRVETLEDSDDMFFIKLFRV